MSEIKCIFAHMLYFFQKESLLVTAIEVAIIVGVLTVIWLRVGKKKSGKRLTDDEKAALVERWIPEPLVENIPDNHPSLKTKLITNAVGKRIIVDGHDCLNLASHNYLNLLGNKIIQERAIKSINKYGVGSCGPRGFYGTIDVHLELEERIAKFMQMEESAVYSYGFSTVASAISAYCKRGDVVFVDECVQFSIQKGLDATRSRIVYFKHNDMDDLEKLLIEQEKLDKKNPKKAARTRRFIIAEAIYMNTGELCPLARLVELRQQYKLRLFLDETVSFGTIGRNGRGITEFLNVNREEVDLICATLENSVGSIGGFTVGAQFIVEHQRLSGLGYCFSASAPPLLAQAAITALDLFENDPNMFTELNDCCEKLDGKLQHLTKLKICGFVLSPVKHLYIDGAVGEYQCEADFLQKIADKCIERNLAVVSAQYLEHLEKKCPRPSIRLAVNRDLTEAEIDFIWYTIENVSLEILP